MINIIIILFVFLSNLAAVEDFETSRFEKFWKRTFKKMNFRDPIMYMPYNIKIGYYAFGDFDYWKKWNQIFKGEDDFGSNPFILSDQNFPDISNHVYRRGLSFELDILKVNFFSKNQNVIDISGKADLLIHDAQYTPEQMTNHKGWGHSSWEQACMVAKEAKVNQLVLFHHNPDHGNNRLEQIESDAKEIFSNSVLAREGMEINLPVRVEETANI